MEKMTLKIQGMTCKNCVSHVNDALTSVDGVVSAKVNLKKGEAVIKAESPNIDALKSAVAAAGYQVI
ncbi:MAG: cation transporter [Lactococcus plantarum]|nr:cation transporter [Lactococcus plantarum]MDN6070538.1 cation transporter [Lactococcus plantarum]MDN6085053.1 cation transporter [Lactococcus plantarum]